MKREILCPECASRYRLHPEDVQNGLEMRQTKILDIKVPARHGVTVESVFHPMEEIRCDHCGQEVKGEAMAVTTWNKHRENEPRFWEAEYSLG